MTFLNLLATALAAYLIGSISFSRIIARFAAPGVDLEQVDVPTQSGDVKRMKMVGATTASMKLGPKVGCAIGLLDILKGFLAVLAARLLLPGAPYYLVAAVFVVVGHNWSVFHRFTGGAGISPMYGGFFVVDWLGTFVSAVSGMIFGFVVVRDILVAYVSGPWLMMVWILIFHRDLPHILYIVAVNLVFLLAFIPDIKDYLKDRKKSDFSMSQAMETFPMGRGMKKIMRFLHLEKKD